MEGLPGGCVEWAKMPVVDKSRGPDHWMYGEMIKFVVLDRFVHAGAGTKVNLFQKGLICALEAYYAEFPRHKMTLGTEGVAMIYSH
jgi:hypothetical protein